MPSESNFFTVDPEPGFLHCIGAKVFASGRGHPYGLRWRLVTGKPAVEEELPCLANDDGRFPSRWDLLSPLGVLYEEAPLPRIELEPVAAALWDIELTESGLPLVVRCLAAWWRISDGPALLSQQAPVLAAALAALGGRRAGLKRTQKAPAVDCGADPAEVIGSARQLQRLLQLSENRSW